MHQRFSVVPAAHVYLVRDREVLLQRRRNTGYMDGHWVAAAAGHIEAGESALAAVVREAKEELGVELKAAGLSPATLLQRTDGSNDPLQQRVDWYFLASEWSGTPTVVEPEKCAALQWHDLDDLPTPVPGYEAVVLEGLRNENLCPFTYFGY